MAVRVKAVYSCSLSWYLYLGNVRLRRMLSKEYKLSQIDDRKCTILCGTARNQGTADIVNKYEISTLDNPMTDGNPTSIIYILDFFNQQLYFSLHGSCELGQGVIREIPAILYKHYNLTSQKVDPGGSIYN